MEEKIQTKKKKSVTASTYFLFLCWLVYACSYLGKVNYSANITQIESYFSVTHDSAGLVSSFFFFAYGAGQIFNGIFCKKYNIKWMIFGSMLVSGFANFVVSVTENFAIIKYLWLTNGLAMSVLWPTLIRLLSETMSKKNMSRASVAMGTTVATGTLIIYGLSALFAEIANFRYAFYVPAIVLPLVGVIWLCVYGKLTREARAEAEEEDAEDEVPIRNLPKEKGKLGGQITAWIILLAFVAVVTNLLKDSLITWVPAILKETYKFPDSLSILITLALPMIAIFANWTAVSLHKKVSDYMTGSGLYFLVGALMILAIIGSIAMGWVIVTVLAFVVVTFVASCSNSNITSIFPLSMKGKGNSGLIAGLLNGFCYVGSTISSYGIGAVADAHGWTAVFWLLFAVAAFVVLLTVGYLVVKKCIRKK